MVVVFVLLRFVAKAPSDGSFLGVSVFALLSLGQSLFTAWPKVERGEIQEVQGNYTKAEWTTRFDGWSRQQKL